MATINFQTLRDWGMESTQVMFYNEFLKTIKSDYTAVPWSNIAALVLFDEDTDPDTNINNLDSFVKMMSIIKPHLVLFNFENITYKRWVCAICSDLEKTFTYLGYANLGYPDNKLLFGLIPKIE